MFAAQLNIIAVFLLIFKHSAASQEGECKFCYSKQPPVAPSDCNPYEASAIQLVCQVKGPIGASLQIKWFFQADTVSNDEINELSNSNDISITTTIVSHDTIKNIQSSITIKDLSIGDYWCRVFHNDIGLLSSQKFGVADENDYGRDGACIDNKMFFEVTEKCADIPIPGHPNNIGSSTCPLTDGISTINPATTSESTSMSLTSIALNVTTCTTNTTQSDSSTMPSATISLLLSTTRSIPSSNLIIRPTGGTGGLMDSQSAKTWLFVVVGLSGTFLLLIVVLTSVFILLCLTGPQNRKKRVNKHRERLDTLCSPLGTDVPSRPLTAMTMQTDLPVSNVQESRVVYNPLDQDYEDIDDEQDKDQSNDAPSIIANPRYHEQGPTTVGNTPPTQPIYTIPTQSLNHVQYSEIGSSGSSNQTTPERANPTSLQMHGYGKLDHSRPRQVYNPKRDSPLLSGYRKLDHVRIPSRSTTLPHGNNSPGYANIEIPNGQENNHHLRSVSLPSSEYSNLNPNPSSQPSTPTSGTPAAATSTTKKYSNFEIIEAYDGEICESHVPISRRGSEDYHMLADATIDRTDPIPHMREEYEFLPVCMCEEDDSTILNSPDSPCLQFGQEFERILMKKGIPRDLIEEKMSINSHSSADFTGPFFFPHMAGLDTPEHERHAYRALDIFTMEPQKGYASINVKNLNES